VWANREKCCFTNRCLLFDCAAFGLFARLLPMLLSF
jgi:hypothetical protein